MQAILSAGILELLLWVLPILLQSKLPYSVADFYVKCRTVHIVMIIGIILESIRILRKMHQEEE